MKSNNLMLMLAAFLVVALGIMGYVAYNQQQALEQLDRDTVMLTKQSNSDETEKIEEDLENTDFENIDKETKDIEVELDSSY